MAPQPFLYGEHKLDPVSYFFLKKKAVVRLVGELGMGMGLRDQLPINQNALCAYIKFSIKILHQHFKSLQQTER